MNSLDIIISLNKYKTNEFQTEFLDDTIKYFQGKGKITKIFENECMLAGIRLHILYNKFYIYLSPKKPTLKTVCYRQLNLSKKQAYNLKNQIDGFKKNTFHICDDVKTENLTSFLIFSSTYIKSEKLYEIQLELALGLIGIHSLRFLEYQNLNNYCKLWGTNKIISSDLMKYKKILYKLPWQTRDRMMIFSGVLYNILGTLFTSDIDILVVVKNIGDLKLKETFKNFNISTFITSDKTITEFYYKIQWFIHKLPYLVGAPDIYTMLINTKYHFYFMGIKCISIDANIERSLSKSNWQSFLDIYLLKIINKIDSIDKLCIKNITIHQDKAIIRTNSEIEKINIKINSFAKKWYNIDIPVTYIEEHFKKCSEKFNTIYKKRVGYIDPLVREQIKIHRRISQYYIMKYGRDKEYLLDLGSGKLSGSYIYKKARIKNVYGVEPSTYSVQMAYEVAKKYPRVNFTIINAFADKPLDIKVKFDIITLIFTIHYMINNIDVVINNIKKMSKQGTIIIITCVNGDKVLANMGKLDRYEIQYYKDIYWGVYRFNTNDKFLFYMKDVYGLELGSEESLVSITNLINKFKTNNIHLIHSNSFKDEYNNIPNSSKLHKFQYDILDIQHILIFRV